MNDKLHVIVTGATGMVGEGVLHECLQHKSIEHELTGYHACFFCLGVSSVGMKEQMYFKMTHTLTLHVAGTLARRNNNMVFCYVSGSGTDSTEKGSLMWARVKGKTENDLLKLPFKKVYNFRPGIIEPTKGLKNTLGLYKYFGWLLPVARLFTKVVTLRQLGVAMINVATKGYAKTVLEVNDIIAAANE